MKAATAIVDGKTNITQNSSLRKNRAQVDPAAQSYFRIIT
jgi:hypothetical protein